MKFSSIQLSFEVLYVKLAKTTNITTREGKYNNLS